MGWLKDRCPRLHRAHTQRQEQLCIASWNNAAHQFDDPSTDLELALDPPKPSDIVFVHGTERRPRL